jgi:hypothetical protein
MSSTSESYILVGLSQPRKILLKNLENLIISEGVGELVDGNLHYVYMNYKKERVSKSDNDGILTSLVFNDLDGRAIDDLVAFDEKFEEDFSDVVDEQLIDDILYFASEDEDEDEFGIAFNTRYSIEETQKLIDYISRFLVNLVGDNIKDDIKIFPVVKSF